MVLTLIKYISLNENVFYAYNVLRLINALVLALLCLHADILWSNFANHILLEKATQFYLDTKP